MSGIGVRTEGGTRVLDVTGDLDVTVAPGLLPEVPSLVAGATALVLDLTDAVFVDSAGVRLVDALDRTCGGRGVPFRVVAPPGGRARRVLEIVGMAGALVSDDLPQALAAVRG